LMNSSSLLDHSLIFFHASGVFSKRFKQIWSQTSHEFIFYPFIHLFCCQFCRLIDH
jgi:hypothetical protein